MSRGSRSNEAFAVVPLAVLRELGRPEDVVNVEGAIAHGYPIGATRAVLTTRTLHSMKCNGLRRGVVTLCIGADKGSPLPSMCFEAHRPTE